MWRWKQPATVHIKHTSRVQNPCILSLYWWFRFFSPFLKHVKILRPTIWPQWCLVIIKADPLGWSQTPTRTQKTTINSPPLPPRTLWPSQGERETRFPLSWLKCHWGFFLWKWLSFPTNAQKSSEPSPTTGAWPALRWEGLDAQSGSENWWHRRALPGKGLHPR